MAKAAPCDDAVDRSTAWPIVPLTAKVAADHFDERPRDAFLRVFEGLKDMLVDQNTKDGPLPGGAHARRAAVVKSKQEASWAGSDKILSKALPSKVVWEDERVLAFRDIAPVAPTHILLSAHARRFEPP